MSVDTVMKITHPSRKVLRYFSERYSSQSPYYGHQKHKNTTTSKANGLIALKKSSCLRTDQHWVINNVIP